MLTCEFPPKHHQNNITDVLLVNHNHQRHLFSNTVANTMVASNPRRRSRDMSRRPLTAEEVLWKDNLKKLYNARKKQLGLNQEKLADMCGWKTQSSVSNYINGVIPLNTDAKIKLAAALQVDVTDIDPDLNVIKEEPALYDRVISAREFMQKNAASFEGMDESELSEVIAQLALQLSQKTQKRQ